MQPMPDRELGKQTLSCADVRELIGNDLDRELTSEMRVRLQQHIDGCAACRAEAVSLAQSLEDIRNAGSVETAAPWFADRTLDRLLTEYESGASGGEEEAPAAGQLELWPGTS
jgi:hypothetical protein